ncbi:MAG: EAL domain-containing protein [Actinomycetota bacterium]|nr:EAL domain-containing protein [Actinomycetota bacterium]
MSVDRPLAGPMHEAPASARSRARAIRIALIEDSPEYALLVRHLLLEELGDSVVIDHCGSIEEAKTVLVDEDLGCILLDLSLPDATGLEALKAVRARAHQVPIVVLSGEENEDVALRAVQEGAQDYLVKRHADGHLLGRAIRYAIERKRAELELAHQATHDALTGLPNRTVFLERLRVTLARIERRAQACAVLFLDLDRFKVVNDSMGHDVGDLLLVEAADRLRALVRPSDAVARFGGDEFMILCDDIATEADAIVVAERIAGSLAEPFEIAGQQLYVGASIGIAVAADRSRPPEAIVRDADQTMYVAKRRGSRWELFHPDQEVITTSRLGLEGELRLALERDELRLYYQPEIDVQGGGVIAVEALLRWQHPERGLLAPGEFIPLAEESGLIVPIGEWVLAESCGQLARWRATGACGPALSANVNLSACQLLDSDLSATVEHVLEKTGLEPGALCLELTETAFVEDLDTSVAVLKALRELGVILSLDDFGTGYSSLSVLDRYPLDKLKIDRSFVARLDSGDRARRLFTAVVGVAQALGLSSVAEGVETREQLDTITDMGCDSAQGFFLSRPREPEVIEALLRL